MLKMRQWKINRILKKIKAMQANRVHNQPSDDIVKKEILYYFELASIYRKLMHNPKYPYAGITYLECYRAAAHLDDPAAHFNLGHYFLEEAKYRLQLDSESILNSPENHKQMQELFKEALAHLSAAEALGHTHAKRLKGLCYINGWGVVADKNAGFDMVVASIEQEGSWDQVPQIFAAIGLNKPEFFSAIMQRRKV